MNNGFDRSTVACFVIFVVTFAIGLYFAIQGEKDIARGMIISATIAGYVALGCEFCAYIKKLRTQRQNNVPTVLRY